MPAPGPTPGRRRVASRWTGCPARWVARAHKRSGAARSTATLAALLLGLALTATVSPAAEAPTATEEPAPAAATEVALTPQGPPAHLTRGIPFGMGDESPAMFRDPLFRWLGVRYARLVVSWNVAANPTELAAATAWLTSAKEAGVQPLVSFDKNYSADPQELPSLPTYSKAVGEFMKLFPWVTDYEPWNEENEEGEPTYDNPARAASYYKWLKGACHGCSVLAADLLDGPSMEHWLKGFVPHVHNSNLLWGLHPYFELTYGGEKTLATFSRLAHGHIWFTEAGTPVWEFIRAENRFRTRKLSAQGEATKRLLTVISHDRHVARVYYYQWRSPYPLSEAESQLKHHERVLQTWDSGLLNQNCSPRPAFDIVARAVGLNPAKAPHTRPQNDAQECVLKTAG